ncbi:MAG: HAD family hydrolase [Treponema sp.]|nr:HAD family hydrolase [Treponema sp.]MCL2272553.1 HAD family hydrolase [Treponema sp.]
MKKKIKMIVSDLDGTLLRTDCSLSEKTIEILAQCREEGVKVVYATGRGGSAEIRAPSHYFDGRINMNGAVARIKNDIVYKKTIPHKAAQPILIACDKYGLKTVSELCGMHYSNFDVTKEWPIIKNFKITDFSAHEIDAEKLYMVLKNPDDVAFIAQYLNNEMYLTVSRDGLVQVMHKDATKSKALAAVAGHWGIAQSEIAAFGDDLNDVDMMEYAGFGVAMENAVDEVKKAAKFSCSNNDADGVAEWINKNVLC